MAIQMIALDVDGTLLTDQHQLSEQTKATVAKAGQLGKQIVLCTGRGPGSAIPVMKELGLNGFLISHNGAVTLNTENVEVLHQFAFSSADIEDLVEYCRGNEIHFDVSTVMDIYTEKLGATEASLYERFHASPILSKDIIQDVPQGVKFTISGTRKQMDEVEEDWASFDWKGNHTRMIRSGDYFIDVMHEDATKGTALAYLAKQMEIEPEQVLAIGNYYNDIEMLEFAGVGIAMDNSPEAVKKAANELTKSNNEEGVHHALLKYLDEGLA